IVYPRYADGPPAAPTRDRQPAELVPPGRLERPHPAPEAGALSAELWGQVARIRRAPSTLPHRGGRFKPHREYQRTPRADNRPNAWHALALSNPPRPPRPCMLGRDVLS